MTKPTPTVAICDLRHPVKKTITAKKPTEIYPRLRISDINMIAGDES